MAILEAMAATAMAEILRTISAALYPEIDPEVDSRPPTETI